MITTNHLQTWQQIFGEQPSLEEQQQRFVLDNFISLEEIANLRKMIAERATEGEGYKGEKFPHGFFQQFSGHIIRKEMRLQKEYDCIFQIQDRIRQVIDSIFKAQTKIVYSQLVSRKIIRQHPLNGQMAHPFHCDQDGAGLENRHYSSVLYLNDEFEGGLFAFQECNFAPRRIIAPKPGRLVCFQSKGNFHGISSMQAGQRDAFVNWYSNK